MDALDLDKDKNLAPSHFFYPEKNLKQPDPKIENPSTNIIIKTISTINLMSESVF